MAETWTKYPLRNIDPKLLRQLIRDAKAQKRSLNDLIRSILCEHYDFDCPPSEADSKLEWGSRTQLLLLDPDVHWAIKMDSERTGISMRGLIMEALERRYVTEEEPAA